MSMELWQEEDYPKFKVGVVRVACEVAQKQKIEEKIHAYGIEKGKSVILSYFDRCRFYGVDVKQSTYKNLNAYLKREAARGALIQCSSGRGSYLSFVFPKKELERMVDEVIENMIFSLILLPRKTSQSAVIVHKTHSLGPSEIMIPFEPLSIKE